MTYNDLLTELVRLHIPAHNIIDGWLLHCKNTGKWPNVDDIMCIRLASDLDFEAQRYSASTPERDILTRAANVVNMFWHHSH